MPCSTTIVIDAWKGRFVLQAKLISETKRVRYLLGLSSPAERAHIESEYFEDDDAFQEMLTAEDDLIDAYARSELAGEERLSFKKRFVSSFHGRDRVQFARAFASAVSDTRPVKTKLPATFFKTFQSHDSLRIAAVIVLVALLAWLVSDRRRMTNELRELRTESAELSKQFEVLQRSSDIERTRIAEVGTQPEQPKKLNTQDATLGNSFGPKGITELPLNARNVPSLLTLQPGTTRAGSVAGARSDQANVTLYAVEGLKNGSPLPRNTSSNGGTTVRGTVKDPQGNVVGGATVTLTDSGRNFTRTQSTNEDGAYVFDAIPPGTYGIEVKAPGFKTALASGLAALVDTPTVRDVQLEVGAVSESVDVTATAEATNNTSDKTLGNSFESKRITELPLNANNVAGLLSLQPGVSRTSDQSTITLDSVDTTIRIPSFLSWVRFQMVFETAAIYEDYRLTIKTADGRSVTSVDWIEPLTPNQTIIDTPAISTSDLPSGNYAFSLMGKELDGSFVIIAEYAIKVTQY